MKKATIPVCLLLGIWILSACTSPVIQLPPDLEDTDTTHPTPLPSNTPTSTETAVPTFTASPLPPPTITKTHHKPAAKTPQPSATVFLLCQPEELDSFLNSVVPYMDQTLPLAREVTQLEELSPARAEEILEEVEIIKAELEKIYVPPCLESAYQSAVRADQYLTTSLEALIAGDLEGARDNLYIVFEEIAWVVTKYSILVWELTATSTPQE
jgi:hypothetical protein